MKTALAKVARSIARDGPQPSFRLCGDEAVEQRVLALAAAHPAHELRVVPKPYLGLDQDGEPVPVGGGDRAQRGLDSLSRHQGLDANAILDRQFDEQVELRVEVVEDRAPRQADLRLEPCDRRAFVPVPGERAAGASRISARLASRWSWPTFGMTSLYKTVRTYLLFRDVRNRSLAGLIAAELVSLTGSAMTFVALPWFVLQTTGSTAKTSWVLAAELLPVVIVGIPAGSVIVRLGAKRTMLISDAVRGPLLVVIPILHHSGHLSFPALLAVTFAIGVFTAPYSRRLGPSCRRSWVTMSAASPR